MSTLQAVPSAVVPTPSELNPLVYLPLPESTAVPGQNRVSDPSALIPPPCGAPYCRTFRPAVAVHWELVPVPPTPASTEPV